ncbi:hypothetical protein TNCT_93371 [Trichonephila clavata]|uniref:Uncharacterized protein n=1 Tax=Trichonephila clavata TaxID=2740835 RepID=A0A8X6FXI5_TRICU|nr:hypothetical protein TNCT_93371 [Trichonephila clavata]
MCKEKTFSVGRVFGRLRYSLHAWRRPSKRSFFPHGGLLSSAEDNLVHPLVREKPHNGPSLPAACRTTVTPMNEVTG